MNLSSLFAVLIAFGPMSVAPVQDQVQKTQDPVAKPLHLSFGVYQTDKATEMYKAFTPLLEVLQDDVAKRLGRSVDIELRIFQNYEAGIQSLVEGSVDFVHFGPASYVTAKTLQPKVRLLAIEHENNEKRFKGVVFVAKASPIQAIEDLKGRSFAFGDKNSTIGRYLVQALMVDHGIHATDLSRFKYLDRHDQVAAAVEHGDFDAGSVKFSTFQKANERGALRAVTTFWNVSKPIVARHELDDQVFEAIQKSLFELADKSALKPLKISGFMPGEDSEFEIIREGMKRSEAFDAPARVPAR